MYKILLILMLFGVNYLDAQTLQSKKIKGFLILEFRLAETHSPNICYFQCGQYFVSGKNLKDTIPFKMSNNYASQVKDYLIEKGDTSLKQLKIGGNYEIKKDSNYLKYVFNKQNSSFQVKSKQIYTKKHQGGVYWIVFRIKGEIWDCKNIKILEEDRLLDEAYRRYQPNYKSCNCSKYVPNSRVYCAKSKIVLSALSKSEIKQVRMDKSNIQSIELLVEL